MYKTYYGLSGEPFGKSETNLYQSAQFKESLSRLEYMKKARGLMLITGDAGVGKSTLIRAFKESLKENSYKVIYLPLTTVNKADFYRQLNSELGGEKQSRKFEMFKSIQKLLVNHDKNLKQTPIIIFDDAQYLNSDNLFELHLLLNFEIDSYDPALWILTGQPHLRERISRPAFASIEQRIVLKSTLMPLSEIETKEYIEHHLKLKGRKEPIFNESGYLAVFKASNGVKRVINRIAMQSIMLGVSKKLEIINEEAVFQATQSL